MELDDLLETLRRIEALHARTDVPGERQAAAVALDAMRRSWPAWLSKTRRSNTSSPWPTLGRGDCSPPCCGAMASRRIAITASDVRP